MSKAAWLSIGLWGYFACAIVFVYGSAKAGDWVTLTGSVLFLIGASAFLVSHYKKEGDDDH